jgi:hypothetical protein
VETIDKLVELFEQLQFYEGLTLKAMQKNFSSECLNFLIKKMKNQEL